MSKAKKERVPEIRFQGFEGEWEENKLTKLATFTKGKGYSKKDLKEKGVPIILYGRLYTKYETVINEVDTFVEEKENSLKSIGGEVIIPASGESPIEIAVASVVKQKDVILGSDLNVIYPNPKLLPTYLALSLSNGENKKRISRKAQGATITHLKNDDLKKLKIIYPSLPEQQQIGQLFENFDRLIELQEKTVEENKRLKKALLQKMFPKKGQKVPEIRLAGFTGEWEERKIESLANKFIGGGTPSTKNKNYWNGDIQWIQTSDLVEDVVLKTNNDKYITDEAISKSAAKIIPPDSIAVVTRVGVGKVALMNDFYTTSQDITSLVDLFVDKYFAVFLIYKTMSKLKNQLQGTSIKGITKAKFLKEKVRIPPLPEQQKIGQLFKILDDTIELEEQTLETYKKLKQSLLQKMFV